MYGIITETKQFVMDNITDSSGEPRKGLIVFKKKTNAVAEAEELNNLRKRMKSSQCYSVQKITIDDVPSYGIIVDGVWKAKL
jgi:hypothetical protein